jgi:nitroreductase
MDSPNYADLLEARFGLRLPLGGDAPPDPTLARILARRTHRRYSEKAVPEGLVDLLLATALSASAKSDYQQTSVIKVKDRGKRDRLAALIPSMPWIGAAPVFLVFCGDARRLQRIAQLRGKPHPAGRLENFFNAAIDAALAMQTFVLASEAVGLGCCPISVLRNHADAVGEILALPDGVFPVAGLCVGYPAAAGFVSLRLPPSVAVHTDRYDDGNLAAEIDAYDRRRDARHAIAPDQQKNPARFGQAAFYGWSEDKARQAAEAEGAAFAAYVRKHGFTLE